VFKIIMKMSQKVDFRGRKGAKNEMENKEKRI
jgi:hypothetical protein